MVRAALIQLNSGPDIGENLKIVEAHVREAAGKGAVFILTPENTCRMMSAEAKKRNPAFSENEHPALALIAKLARELKVWILLGSIEVKVGDKNANRSYLFSETGEKIASYDKIHLFNVDLPNGDKYREGDTTRPGDKAVIAQTPFGVVGMTICYDLRFAHLYRELAKAGANIIVVPAAFTVPTGQAHWEPLLRARAIETGSFVLAPGQCGTHYDDRKTYGHSLAIGPWGEILAEGGDEPGVIMVDLDLKAVDKARGAIPALMHDREFVF